MTDFPWFPLYVDDWTRSTATMTDEQAGAYMRLLCHAWAENGLPTDEAAIRAIGRWSPAAWKRIWPVVSTKWFEHEGRLMNGRQERERQGRDAFRDARSAAGKRGASQRWQSHSTANGKAIAQPMAQPMANDSDPHPHPQVHPQESEQKTLTLVAGASVPPSAVELSTGQLQAAVPGLVGAWNNIAAVVSPFVAVSGFRSHPKATAALRAHPDIDWWSGVFSRATASDFLRGVQPMSDGRTFVADFWWCLDNAEKIAAGRYDNRERVAPAAPMTKAQAISARNAASAAAVIASLRAEGAIS